MIDISQLKKSFGGRSVLDGLSVQIPAGQATGLIGPNGAGKTTLIKSILGLVKPDSGEITIQGKKLNGHWMYRKEIGYMPQVARYPEKMKVHELFSFIRNLRGEEALYEQELIDRFQLRSELEKPLSVLSGGNRQKAGAVLAMMFAPSILFLDEPTAGLDPRSSLRFKETVHQEIDRGKTVLITSHIMSELEQLVSHVIFVLDGRVRFYGSLETLFSEVGGKRLEPAIAAMMEEDE
ncbi:MAG: ABC transporter ATP-binding protein [Balneolaceae bacterium]